jgi:pSer/pThr/pTyr-binding forkhead associated (FHA) protein
MRAAVDEDMLATKVDDERPPKPLTNRIPKLPKTVEAVAWLWCDPLPAIPLVSGKQVIVGRQDTCDLVLPHKEVSRAHAVFKITGKQITLEDQGSSNGCFVNTKRCTNQIVKVGDRIQIGPYEIEVRESSEDLSPKDAGDTKSFDVTAVNATGPSASMAGRLSDVPLSEILQGIEFHAKTCTLSISDGKLKGKIVFNAGKPLTASWGGERDLDAVRSMLRLKDGRFFLTNEVDPTDPTMTHTVTAVLLDAARDSDEATVPEEEVLPAPSETAVVEEPLEGDGTSTEPPPVEAYGIVEESLVPEPAAAEAAVAESPPEEPKGEPQS